MIEKSIESKFLKHCDRYRVDKKNNVILYICYTLLMLLIIYYFKTNNKSYQEWKKF